MSKRPGLLGVVVSAIAILAMPATPGASMTGQQQQAGNIEKLLNDNDCHSCHASDRKVVGPSYGDVAARYATQSGGRDKLTRTIREGSSGVWGNLRMPPHPDLKDEQLDEIIAWILSLKDAARVQTVDDKAKEYKYPASDGRTITLDFPLFLEDGRKVTKDVFRGYEIYNSYCYRCHGQDANPSELAPDLQHFVESATARQDFLSVAMTGREDKGMPAWAGFFSEEEVQKIYQYVKGRSAGLISAGRPPSEYD
jgi:cytochrome c